uniref:Uncharacterized protein n=1 Tax=Cacopsylla melanoneura TaxID=428564 RepID=A0A8D8RKF8_9HEMI
MLISSLDSLFFPSLPSPSLPSPSLPFLLHLVSPPLYSLLCLPPSFITNSFTNVLLMPAGGILFPPSRSLLSLSLLSLFLSLLGFFVIPLLWVITFSFSLLINFVL